MPDAHPSSQAARRLSTIQQPEDRAGRPADGVLHRKIREFLFSRGASFFPPILLAAGGFQGEVLEALWDLVWAGEVTNDTLQPLRAYLRRRTTTRSTRTAKKEPEPVRQPGWGRLRRFPTSGYTSTSGAVASRSGAARTLPPEASGRWSLVSSLVFCEASPAERLAAQARLLLERYGVLTREAVQAEGIPGGFSSVYGVLKMMEEAGQVRRGYFVAGLGATQFALPGAVDRLRAVREPADEIEAIRLAATDPANPYGNAIPWPEKEGRRPMRMAGASVILVDGALAAWIARGDRQLLTFFETVPEREPEQVALAAAEILADLVGPGRRRALLIQEVDGRSPHDTALGPALMQHGFRAAAQGFLKRM